MTIYLVHEIVLCEFSKTLRSFKSEEAAAEFVLNKREYNKIKGISKTYDYEIQEVELE